MPIPIETFMEAQAAQAVAEPPRSLGASDDIVVQAATRLTEMPREQFVNAWVRAREVLECSDDDLRGRLNESLTEVSRAVAEQRQRDLAEHRLPPIADYVELTPTGWDTPQVRGMDDFVHVTDWCGSGGRNGGFIQITSSSAVSYNVSASVCINATSGWAVSSTGTGGNGGSVRINPPTAEELAAAEARRAEWVRQEAERQVLREQAKARARELLLERLSVVQREEFEREGSFRVMSQRGRIYRIRLGWTRNVDLLDDAGEIEAHFCLHPETEVPEEDNVLAQKLLLECCEDDFLRIANRSTPAPRHSSIRVIPIPQGEIVARDARTGLPLVG